MTCSSYAILMALLGLRKAEGSKSCLKSSSTVYFIPFLLSNSIRLMHYGMDRRPDLKFLYLSLSKCSITNYTL